jgi:hypothetical protein
MDNNYLELLEKSTKKLEEISMDCPKEVLNYLLKTKLYKDKFEIRKEELNLICLMKTDNPCESLRMHNIYLSRK